MATPHGWTNKGQERGAMVLKPTAPQAKAIKLEAENRELHRKLAEQGSAIDTLMAALKEKGILGEE